MARCPHCRRVLTDRDLVVGTCVACSKTLPARVRAGRPHGGDGPLAGRPAPLWAPCAAGLCIAAPVAMLVVDRLFQRELAVNPDLARPATSLLSIAVFVLMGGLVLGLAALVAAVKTKSWRTAAWSVAGTLANGGILAAWACGALFRAP